MPDPFDSFKTIFGSTPGQGPFTHTFTPGPDPEPDEYEVTEETFPVVLPCKACGDPCRRSVWESGNPWVHEEDAHLLDSTPGTACYRRRYDHEAQPDYIDAEVIQDDHNRSKDRPDLGQPAPGIQPWFHGKP